MSSTSEDLQAKSPRARVGHCQKSPITRPHCRGTPPTRARVATPRNNISRSDSTIEIPARGRPSPRASPRSARVKVSYGKLRNDTQPAFRSSSAIDIPKKPAQSPRNQYQPVHFGGDLESPRNESPSKNTPSIPRRRPVRKNKVTLDISTQSAPDVTNPTGPTRAYGKRSEFYTEDKVNHRLSKNLTAPAVSLHFRLTSRPQYETLRSSMIIKDAISPQPYATATWTSKARIYEDWLTQDTHSDAVILISRDCLESGYHIEVPRKDLPQKDDLELMDADRDVKFFEQLSKAESLTHLVGENRAGDQVIVSIEHQKSKKFQRAIIRTDKEDQRLLIKTSSSSKLIKALSNQCPLLISYKLAKVPKSDTAKWTEELLKIESQMVERTYKFGVLYAKDGQTTEDQFFNNVEGSDALYTFLSSISSKVQLDGWKHFRGGLDTKCGTTGEFSYYQIHKGCEIMFHVSTLIPYYPKDEQQVERKRHLGNDIVVIIFKEGNEPFNPLCIRSHFNHVFVVVQPVQVEGKTHYSIEWCTKPEVPPFTPFEKSPSIYESTVDFQERFLTKLLNAQRAAMLASPFEQKATRTRKMLFNNVIQTLPFKR